jgi:urea carboxylase-associated protein 2
MKRATPKKAKVRLKPSPLAPMRTRRRPMKLEAAPDETLEILSGGQAWSRRMQAGEILRLGDVSGRACVSALFYNAREPLERYNMADTLKAQYTAYLSRGRVLFSDMGRILMSIVADTCGWHDTIAGCGDAAAMEAQFGRGRYQELRNGWYRNARDNFLVELGKHGMGKRDIVPNVNLFAAVVVDDEGRMMWRTGNSHPGAYVDLRCEMDCLVVLSNTPHPLDASSVYAPPEVELRVRRARTGELAGPSDECRRSRPENDRGFALTELYNRQVREVAW